MNDLELGIGLGLVFGAVVMATVFGYSLERALKRVKELETAQNGPERPIMTRNSPELPGTAQNGENGLWSVYTVAVVYFIAGLLAGVFWTLLIT